MLGAMTAGCPRHDLITLTGGAIGQGLPNAVGAAIACPERPVLALIGDGTAMYTIQALWTMARENLHVTAIIFNNASYSVLNVELERVGAIAVAAPRRARSSTSTARAWTSHGWPRAWACTPCEPTRAEEFCKALEYALATPGRT
jgi:acetolactate synthase-1/2/3 large subunit